ncbi:Endoplasmic reticulum mannosyl-oligosaccharide 1,2-alpha-mannosidase [Perkinsus olseni]|uniref:Endoplasmic reticulum mannosyl-oligosaccharide 1,2-alpha-mannosidase n=1 Tax=Perkinsus olseni TaxID=32597 RepID=A0A7J6KWY0_PEROL|nr:Endoplasmic reticulum mannosyl-oligosaccharide 1,2-alpha-mannosidase [Perkinsus olseni]KAF4652858.1 Endoplasmic reticulum mannosyl-oligosaccharide 1,2-alpha-mannosidase [Perkinsus olseni]
MGRFLSIGARVVDSDYLHECRVLSTQPTAPSHMFSTPAATGSQDQPDSDNKFTSDFGPSPITPGDGFRVATVEHQCIPSTGARHSCVDDTTVFGIGDDDGGDSLRASSSILTTSFPGGNTASALIAAEELSTLHSLVVKKAADVSARERTLMHRQSAMGAEIVKAQQMIQDLAARLLVDAQSSLNSTAGKLTKRLETLMSRVTCMLQETRQTAAERREREKANSAMQEELKSLRSRIASYKSAAASAKEEYARLKKRMSDMSAATSADASRNQSTEGPQAPPQPPSVEVQALRARVSTLKTAAGAARDECIRLKKRLEDAREDVDKATSIQAKLRKRVADLEAENKSVREEIIEVEHRAAEHSLAEVERLTRHLDNLETENQRLRSSVEELHRHQEEVSQPSPHLVSTATSPRANWGRGKEHQSPSPPRLPRSISLFEASFAEDTRSMGEPGFESSQCRAAGSGGPSAHTLLTASLPYFSDDAAAAIGALIVLTSSEMDSSLLSRVASVLNRAITLRLSYHRGDRRTSDESTATPARSIMERAKRRMLHQRLGMQHTRPSQSVMPRSSLSRYQPIDVLQYATGAPDARRVALAALGHLHMPADPASFRVRLFTDAGLQDFLATVMADQRDDPACLAAAVALGCRPVARGAEEALASLQVDSKTWEYLLLLAVQFEISSLQTILTVDEERAKALSTEALRLLIEDSLANTATGDFSRRVLGSVAEIDCALLQPSRDSIIDTLSLAAMGGPAKQGSTFLKRLLRLVDRSQLFISVSDEEALSSIPGIQARRNTRGEQGQKNISLDDSTAADVKIQRGGRRFSQVQVANRRAIVPASRSLNVAAMMFGSGSGSGSSKGLRSRNIRGSVGAQLADRAAAARVVGAAYQDRPVSGGLAERFFSPAQSGAFNMKLLRITGFVLVRTFAAPLSVTASKEDPHPTIVLAMLIPVSASLYPAEVLCMMAGSGLIIATNLHYTTTAERQRDIFLRNGIAPRVTAQIQSWLGAAMQVRDTIHWAVMKQIYTDEFDYGTIRQLVEPAFGQIEGLISVELAFSTSPHIVSVNAVDGPSGAVESILLQSDAPSCFSIGSLGCLQRSEASDSHSTAWYEIGSSLDESDTPLDSNEAPTLWAGPTIRPDASNQYLIPIYTMIWKSVFPAVVGEPFLVGRATIDVRALSSLLVDEALADEGQSRVFLTTRQGTVVSARQPLASYVDVSGSDGTTKLKSVWEVSPYLEQLTIYDYSDVYRNETDGPPTAQLVSLPGGACVIYPFPTSSSTGVAFALVAFSEVEPFVDPTMAGLLVSCVVGHFGWCVLRVEIPPAAYPSFNQVSSLVPYGLAMALTVVLILRQKAIDRRADQRRREVIEAHMALAAVKSRGLPGQL